jgi:plasmid rolling circle replication initiator protein Rep
MFVVYILWFVWVLNISNMNNILNLIANFKAMKMCFDVEYNSDSFRICVWVLNL